MLAADIDGTLTVDRGVFTLDLDAVKLLRELAARGVHVILVTGNSVPVVAGLARYLGFEDSPHVAENGCMVFYRGSRYRVCREDVSDVARLVEARLSNYLYPSWQNVYRHCDYAFNLKDAGKAQEALSKVEELVRRLGREDVSIGYSGYAIHIRPRCSTKAAGLRLALKLVEALPSETIAVGDSPMDAELREASRLLVAVGNADPALKKVADIIAPGKSGESVRWLVSKLLELDLDIDALIHSLGASSR